MAILIASTAIFINSSAQSTAKPSVPEFTISYVDRSYDVAPTYTKDPYTGETEMLHPGYRATNIDLDVTIKNQAFTSHKTVDGNFTQLCYFIRAKGHFDQWITDNINEGGNILIYNNSMLTPASSSGNTVLTFPLNHWNIKPGGQIDFQVKAVIANFYYRSGDPSRFISSFIDSEVIEEGDWSSSQTFTIPEALPSVSPSPTVPEFSFLAILSLLVVIPLIMITVKKKICQGYN